MADDWKEIARLKFTGDDFSDGVLDVRALTEILCFRRIVQATAKSLWLAAHPGRKQLPDHFDDRIFLGFRAIRSESVEVPIEARVINPEQLLLWDDQDPANLAAKLAYATFDAAGKHRDLPKLFTRGLLPEYAKLGQGLPDGAGFSIGVPQKSPIPVTQEERDWLTARLDQDYEDRLDVTGRVLSVDVEKKTLAIQTGQERRIEIEYALDQEQEAIGALSAYETARVRLRGQCLRKPGGELRHMVAVESLDFFPDGEPERDPSAPSIEDKILDLFRGVPEEEWERVPADLSTRLDHYLYGVDDS